MHRGTPQEKTLSNPWGIVGRRKKAQKGRESDECTLQSLPRIKQQNKRLFFQDRIEVNEFTGLIENVIGQFTQ